MKQVQPTLISRRHLAERWSVSLETLKRREKEGVLIPLIIGAGIGAGVRYRIADIERIEKESEVKR
jgi:hypothetical protein